MPSCKPSCFVTVAQRVTLLGRPLSRCTALGIRAQAAAGVFSQPYGAPAQQVRGWECTTCRSTLRRGDQGSRTRIL